MHCTGAPSSPVAYTLLSHLLPSSMISSTIPWTPSRPQVRCIFYFAPPPPPGAPPKRVAVPYIPPSPCNIAFVDNTSVLIHAAGGANSSQPIGWTPRRISAWPFPGDAPRSAHLLKVVAPLLFPRASHVLAGDVKCLGLSNGYPCDKMRATGTVDLAVAKNRWFKARSVEGEFVHTWKHMRLRQMAASVFRDINELLSLYERQGYDMDPIHLLPDTYCMGWRPTRPSLTFACRLGCALRSFVQSPTTAPLRPCARKLDAVRPSPRQVRGRDALDARAALV